MLTVAVTGADVFRENNPNIPYTTEEIADSAIEAAAAGATVAHLHVREDDGTPSGRPELFVDVIDRIRAGCDLLTMVSTGGANDMTIDERTTGLEASPDISGVESGSMNFGDETFITPPPAGRGIVEQATAAGIALEVEAFDVGHVVSAVRWLEQGVLEAPMRINLVFGVPGGIDASPEALDAMLRPLPPETFWTVTCIGRHHRRMLGAGAAARRAGDPHRPRGRRLHLSRGVHAPSNAALVEMAVDLARTLGREVATQEQTGSCCALADAGRRARRAEPPAPRAAAARRPARRSTGAAVELFARLGYHATSMRAIASAAGGPAGRDLPLVPEQGGDPGPAPGRLHGPADRAGASPRSARERRPALRLAAAVREHVVFHGVHPRRRSSPTARSARSPSGPRRR